MQLSTSTDALARFGHALSDPTRTRVLLRLRQGPAYPADLADGVGVTRQAMSNHLACLRGCGLVVAVPEGRRSRYELADQRLAGALGDLLDLVLVVDPACCGGEGGREEGSGEEGGSGAGGSEAVGSGAGVPAQAPSGARP